MAPNWGTKGFDQSVLKQIWYNHFICLIISGNIVDLFALELCLFSKTCYAAPHLLSMLLVALFIISRSWFKVIILLYCVTLVYDIIKLPVVIIYYDIIKLPIWCLYSSLLLSLYFGNHLSETINNYIVYIFSLRSQSLGETTGIHLPPLFPFPFSSKVVTIVLKNF